MKLSVVLGTYNRLNNLRNCINSVISETSVGVKIYVTDAGSTDGTIDYLKSIASDSLIPIFVGEKIGQAKALNDVFKIIDTTYVCWLSDDNVVVDRMLDTAVGILHQNPDIGMVSLKVKDVAGAGVNLDYLGGVWPSGILNCNQGMLPTAVIRELRGFDEKFRDYGVDADLTTRVLLSGYNVVFTKGVVIHHFRDHDADSWIDRDEREKRLQMARELYQRKYHQLIVSDYGGVYDKVARLRSRKMRQIKKLYAGSRSEPLNYLLGGGMRDWRNVILGRFISDWDLIKNRYKNYYLVQEIPEKLRVKVQIHED